MQATDQVGGSQIYLLLFLHLVKYAKKLASIVINESIMEDKIFDIIISDEDKAQIFFLVSEKLRETGEEYLSLLKKREWKN